MTQVVYGYKQKNGVDSEGQAQFLDEQPFGIKGFDKVQHFTNDTADFTLQNFYDNFRSLIDNGNFFYKSSTAPTGTEHPEWWEIIQAPSGWEPTTQVGSQLNVKSAYQARTVGSLLTLDQGDE